MQTDGADDASCRLIFKDAVSEARMTQGCIDLQSARL
jgi:hypothetical protein